MRLLPFVYQYAIMWIIMGIGIWLAVKSGNLDPATPYGKKYLFILIGGLLLMMSLQAVMQFIFPRI